jgi:hypothetical protein
VARENGEPVGLDHRVVRRVLAVEDHPHGFPTQRFPRVKVIRIPEFCSVLAMAEDLLRGLTTKALLGGSEQLREIPFQRGDNVETQTASAVQEGSTGEFPIDDDVVGKGLAPRVTPFRLLICSVEIWSHLFVRSSHCKPPPIRSFRRH